MLRAPMISRIALFLAIGSTIGYVAPIANAAPALGRTVYITKSGDKYHGAGCRYLSHSKIAIDIDDARKQGYSACSRCSP